MSSILFVCMGNICRSPSGENVMRKLLDDAGLGDSIRCDSAGTIGFHVGNPPDPRMSQAGRNRGYAMTGSARKVTPSDLDEFDLILAMDNENFADLERLSTPANRHKVRRFCEFCIQYPNTEVPDPYYGGARGFEIVLDLLEDGCKQILKQIKEQL
ncbi:low molecular weight phosphotyrosine protein phosphatase [Pelagicoccus mobilis]|uniref:Low molecular weight phosphotyrosine protein phosphatase n=1 Tax=Pelagicoccus mobilis TaxID=415221 RepID=A0A934VSA2_9BACT|nr:low molecular weight phosphotyrosine protein phosphatase [Pelagicoccus mobilis]